FYEIPFLHWQITPIRRQVRSLETALFLRQNNLIDSSRPPTVPTPRPEAEIASDPKKPVADSSSDQEKGPVSGPPSSVANETWHLNFISRGFGGSTAADAGLLVDQLSIEQAGDKYWKTWSIDHPKKAKAFWRVIQRLARRELYVLMPRLFEIAQRNLEPIEMNDRIDDLMRSQYLGLIEDAKIAGQIELVEALTVEAAGDFDDWKDDTVDEG
ncbi:MAG: hypothetical protein AAF989_09085, partial [Planctomycetota bacterium]